MNTKRILDGILYRKLKGQIVVSELGMVKVGLLLLIVIGCIVIFLFFSGYIDKAVEWVTKLFTGGE